MARGLYDYPNRGAGLPGIDAIASALKGRDQSRIQPAGAHAANVLGLSIQVPVRIVFLLLGPPDSTRLHVDLLARIAYLVRTPGFLDQIKSAADPRRIMEAIRAERERRA